jgi:hypothetical protein
MLSGLRVIACTFAHTKTGQMKKLLTFVLAISILSACSTTIAVKGNSPKPLPPGQAKKVTGSQSAKPYAPGQQKNQPKKKN